MPELAKWKILVRDTLLILVISVALLAGIEVALRVIFADRLPPPRKAAPPTGELAYEFHPEYLMALKPSIERVYQRAPECFTAYCRARGFQRAGTFFAPGRHLCLAT